MTNNTNTDNCPLCQQNNHCEVNSPSGCWCTTKKVPTLLIDQVPQEKKRKACICQACIDKFNLAQHNITNAS